MVDGDSKPFSIERCRELLGTEDSGLSDEEIEAIRVQTDAWAQVLLDIYLDQQRQERAREVASDEPGSIPVWSENGSRLEINALAKTNFKRSNRLTFTPACVCGDWENLVAQIFPRWNPLTSWMRQLEDFQRAA
jgi:hypothetical protein